MQLKRLLSILLVIVLAFSIVACNSKDATNENVPQDSSQSVENSADEAKESTEERILKIDGDNLGYPSVYTVSSKGRGYLLTSYIFDTLTWKDETGIVPLIAKEWKVSNDNKTWTFYLNENAKFTDGKELTSEDVKFSFEYIKEHPYQWVSVSPVKEVRVIDKYTVEIELNDIYAPFITDIAGNVPIMPKHIWENVTEPEKFNTEDAVIGSGPLKLVQYDKEAGSYIFSANENYFLGKPVIDKLIISASNNPKEALENGELNGANNIKYGEAKQLKEAGKFKVIEGPGFWVGRLYFNFAVEEFNIKEFRQALYYGIDRDEYVTKALKGGADPGNPGHIHPKSEWYYKDVKSYEYNPEKSKELLSNLGMKDTNSDGILEYKDKELKYELIASEGDIPQTEMLKKYMNDIGIDLEVKALDSKSVDSMIKEGKFTLALSGHGSFGGDPVLLQRFVSSPSSGSTPEITTQGGANWSNEEFNRIFEEQLKELDKDKRYNQVARLQEIIAEELPTLTLNYRKITFAYDDNIFDGWFFTKDGVAIAVPTVQNKLVFIKGTWNK